MTWAQAVYSEQADNQRTPAPCLEVGDEVWLLRRNIETTRPGTKLDFKRLSKFLIIEKISSHAYKLDLPTSMKVLTVLHVSLLEPAASDPLPGRVQPPPPPVIVDEGFEYEVEAVVDSKRVGRSLEYHVQWVGYDQSTWEPAALLANIPTAVRAFH